VLAASGVLKRRAVGVWFTGFLYGFAHGVVTSLVAQFGGVPGVALAAGGSRGHDRAQVRVTAHASCGRLSAACGGRLKSRAGPPAGLYSGGGRASVVRRRSATGRPGYRTGLRRVVWWRSLLVVAVPGSPTASFA